MILSDNPIRDASGDEFGFRAHAEVLCRAIAEVHDLPLTLAILGSWGSGRTSLLNICRNRLQKHRMATVGFRQWKYDRRDKGWYALLQTLVDELIRHGEEAPSPNGDEKRRRHLIKRARTAERGRFVSPARGGVSSESPRSWGVRG